MDYSAGQLRARIAAHLRRDRAGIERALVDRVHGISPPPPGRDPAYADGLRSTVSAVIDYALEAIGSREGPPPPVPEELVSQARLAARKGVALDTVLRRYIAGSALLSEFLLGAAGSEGPLDIPFLHRFQRLQVEQLDSLLAAVGEAYGREREERRRSADYRRAERIARLLAGEAIDTRGFAYDFEGWHIALTVAGHGTTPTIRRAAGELDRRLLLVSPHEGLCWAWLGARREARAEELESLLAAAWPPEARVAISEPGEGLAGWRFAHRQAELALPVAERGPDRIVRYADVALLATVLADDVLAASLRRSYLEPLERQRDGGTKLRNTLWAYFASGRHVSSTASTMGVSRQTVARRLQTIEERIGCSLEAAGLQLEVALRYERLSGN
jgi:hypothetical protein